MDEEATKRCNRCKKVKALTDFYPNPNVSDGRQGNCSNCAREIAHIKYLKKMGKTETMKRRTIDSPVASKEGHRICTRCGEEKPLEEFEADSRKESGHTFRCRACAKAYKSKWAKDGGEAYQEKRKIYREENRDMLLEGKKRHYHANKAYYRERGREYYLEHQKEYLEYGRQQKAKQKENPDLRMPDKLRKKLRDLLFAKRPHLNTEELVGCTTAFFRAYIQSLWKEGMTWDNYGAGRLGHTAWQLDHIIPVSSFDLDDPVQLHKCFHYTNIQPLWWQENASKHNNIT